MASSPKRSAKCHVRSVSLPTRSHPASLKIVDELSKLRSSGSSARSGLAALEDLYEAVNEFLAVTSTRNVISSNKTEGCVDELLDGLVRILEAFDLTRDLVSEIKERSREVQSAIRRRNIEEAASDHTKFKKKLRKDVKKVTTEVKRIKTQFEETFDVADHDRAFFSTMGVLREIVAFSASVLQSLLLTIDNSKGSKLGVILSKFVHKGGSAIAIASDGNEFEALDEASQCLSKDESIDKAKNTRDRLRDLENGIAHIEDDLDGSYKRLVRTRASLLNIISQ